MKNPLYKFGTVTLEDKTYNARRNKLTNSISIYRMIDYLRPAWMPLHSRWNDEFIVSDEVSILRDDCYKWAETVVESTKSNIQYTTSNHTTYKNGLFMCYIKDGICYYNFGIMTDASKELLSI